MRFEKKINVAAGATTVDPRVSPAGVPRPNTYIQDACLLNCGTAPRKTLCALEGTAGNTATIQFWVLDGSGFGKPDIQPDEYADIEWYSLGAAVALTVGEAAVGPVLPEGWVYIQITAGPAADAVVKVGSAP